MTISFFELQEKGLLTRMHGNIKQVASQLDFYAPNAEEIRIYPSSELTPRSEIDDFYLFTKPKKG